MTSRPEREHPRYAHEAAVTFRWGKQFVQGRTQNMSRGGLCATLASPIPMGTEVEVDIVLVFEDEQQSEALRLPARVAWCTRVDDAHQIGLSFRPLDAERMDYLAMFLGYLDGARAEKAPRNVSVDDRFR